ncbi:hypothetical protein SDC9_188778 [bioreactor metagenome]|uniref:Uncharacterized protein n=1 Tax=bioreactor metagenome TaxID=1076179 RepID=A0A645HRL5_9ZZZZ
MCPGFLQGHFLHHNGQALADGTVHISLHLIQFLPLNLAAKVEVHPQPVGRDVGTLLVDVFA